MNLFLQLIGNGIIQGALVACLAAGFGFVYRSFRIFHIAMGAQYVFSCYSLFLFSIRIKCPLIIAIFCVLFLSIVFAWSIELAVYRPFFKKRCSSGVVMIASLGIMTIMENLIALFFGNNVKTISNQLEPSVIFCGLRFTRIQLLQFFVSLVLFVGIGLSGRRIRRFKALWALGDQPELISVLGLPLNFLRLGVMTLSGILIAVPAMLLSYDIGTNPHLGMHYLLLASVAVFFGSVDHYWAWGFGALLLTIMQTIAVWIFSSRWTDLVTFSILLFVILFRPQGVFGLRKRLEEEQS